MLLDFQSIVPITFNSMIAITYEQSIIRHISSDTNYCIVTSIQVALKESKGTEDSYEESAINARCVYPM